MKSGYFLILYLVVGLVSLLLSTALSSESEVLCLGFVKDNNMKIPIPVGIHTLVSGGLTQDQFMSNIAKVETIYTPIFTQKGLPPLEILKTWSSSTVNAQARRENGMSVVEIWGGLARHPLMTEDGLVLVTCHEVGHHLGGLPKFAEAGGTWAAVEGAADYFATMKCMRKVFAVDINSWDSSGADATVKQKCESNFGVGTKPSLICMRIGMASMVSAALSGSLDGTGTPSFNTSDPSQVQVTFEQHPASQCRLDTYVHGDICQVLDTVDFSDSSIDQGACRNIASEEYGARPRCWFKPSDSVTPPPPPPPNGIAQTPMLNGQLILHDTNPNQLVQMSYDLTNIPGAYGYYMEAIGPNMDFSVPNGTQPDPRAMPGGSVARVKGVITFLPARQLPGWGVYKFRIIPLDRTGRNAVGRFSNPAVLQLTPQ